jgi:hypothetical protein
VLCLLLSVKFLVWMFKFSMCVVLGLATLDIGTLSGVFFFFQFKIITLGHTVRYISASSFFVPFVVSAWCLKCTKHLGCNGDVQGRMCVRTEDRWFTIFTGHEGP